MARFAEGDLLPVCPHCKQKLSEVLPRPQEGREPQTVTCPKCKEAFDLPEAVETVGRNFLKRVAEDLQREIDELNRR